MQCKRLVTKSGFIQKQCDAPTSIGSFCTACVADNMNNGVSSYCTHCLNWKSDEQCLKSTLPCFFKSCAECSQKYGRPSRRMCPSCGNVKWKAHFTLEGWKQADDLIRCSLCSTYTETDAWNCGKCYKAKGRQSFRVGDLLTLEKDPWCLFCLAKANEEKDVPGFMTCNIFKEHQPQTNFSKTNNGAREIAGRICKSCLTPCERCGKSKPDMEFAQRRMYRQLSPKFCIQCAQNKAHEWNEEQIHEKNTATEWCDICKLHLPKTAFSTTQLETTMPFRLCIPCADKHQKQLNNRQQADKESRIKNLVCAECETNPQYGPYDKEYDQTRHAMQKTSIMFHLL